jgi:transposase InsO family protein
MAQHGVISWRAGCAETCTSGSEGGPGKRTGGNTATAPRSDPYTYVRCHEGMVFFSFVIDVYSRRIVGWQFAGHMRTDLVLDALRMALTRRRHGADVDLIHHSDAGSQYTSLAFQQVLDDHHVLGSIGSVGDAYDTQSRMPILDAVGWV